MASSSSTRKYQVFISHAGEDKQTIAIPLRDMLLEKGITAFVDEKDIPPGGAATDEITSAMDNADLAVIVLSPEFVAKKWPMKELLFFLKRREKARANDEPLPIIIPVFYRLSVADMYREPCLDRIGADGRSLYGATRFFERRDNRESEADVKIIRDALCTLHGIQGVNNKSRAPKDVCDSILKAIALRFQEHTGLAVIANGSNSSGDTNNFRRYFHTEYLRDVVLDFASVGRYAEPLTYEGRIRRGILNCENTDQVFAIVGWGGVGKSTILKGLTNDDAFREIFSDGIHLISLGMDATALTLFEELLRVLRNSGAKRGEGIRIENSLSGAIREATDEALSLFRGKKCAFLIDDVWTKEIGTQLFSHLLKLGSTGRQSAVVFTTRENGIASAAPLENIYRVDPRTVQGAQSRDILFYHAGVMEDGTTDSSTNGSIEEILEICCGLPVSLAAAGKGVKILTIDIGTLRDAWSEIC